jgi:hypothetical protein
MQAVLTHRRLTDTEPSLSLDLDLSLDEFSVEWSVDSWRLPALLSSNLAVDDILFPRHQRHGGDGTEVGAQLGRLRCKVASELHTHRSGLSRL